MKKIIPIVAFIFLLSNQILSQSNNAALRFDGTQSLFFRDLEITGTNEWTVEAWLNPKDVSAGVQTIVSHYHAIGLSNTLFYKLYIEDSKLYLTLNDRVTDIGGNIQPTTTYLVADPVPSGWFHMAVVILDDNLKGFINGELISDQVIVPYSQNLPPNYFGISWKVGEGPTNADVSVLGDYYDGDIDEFRIWDKAQSEEEISINFNQGLTGFEAGLAVYYDFNEGDPEADNLKDGLFVTEYKNYDPNCGGTCPPGQEGKPNLDTYFDTPPAVTVNNFKLDAGYGTSGPGGVANDYFTSYTYGKIVAPETDVYTIHAIADDGVIVVIDGEIIIDNWNFNDGTEFTGEIELIGGQEYEMEVLHFEAEFGALLRIYWSSSNYLKQAIPSYVHVEDVSRNGFYAEFENFALTGTISNYVAFTGPNPKITSILPLSANPDDTINIYGIDLDNIAPGIDGVKLNVLSQSSNRIEAIIPSGNIEPGIKNIGNRINFSGKQFTLISGQSTAAYSTANIITSYLKGEQTMPSAERVEPADLDGDGDLDLIVTSQGLSEDPNAGSVAWYENLDGKGTYSELEIIYESPSAGINFSTIDIAVSDLNQDGWVDIIIADADNQSIRWVRNLGEARFASQELLFKNYVVPNESNTRDIRPFELEIADFSGDGFPDIIFAVESEEYTLFGSDFGIFYLENPAFGLVEALKISDRPMLRNYINERTYPNTIQTLDFNKDGILDIVAGSRDGLIALVNDGSAFFTEIMLYPLDRGINDIVSMVAGDIEKDGDIDAVVTINQINVGYTLELLRNEEGEFRSYSIEKFGIPQKAEFVSDLADIDGDSDLDILTFGEDEILFHQDLTGAGDFSGPVIIDKRSAKQIQNLKAADIDLDGKLDLVSTSSFDNKVIWFNNRFGPITGISPRLAFPGDLVKISGSNFSSLASDNIILFNGVEAELDAEKSNNKELYAFVPSGAKGTQKISLINSNTGIEIAVPPFNFTAIDDESAARFWNTQLELRGPDSTNFAGVELADLDNDNDLDLIVLEVSNAASEFELVAYVVIYENIGNNEFKYRKVIVDEEFNFQPFFDSQPGVLESFDVANDGYNDIIVNKMYIRNQGGNFEFDDPVDYTELLILQLFRCITYGDLNNDGYLDIVGGTSSRYSDSPKLLVFLNDGLGFFEESVQVSVTPEDVYDVALDDVDGDGDLDIITAEPKLDKIAWFENSDGLGTFNSIEKVIDTSLEGLFTIDLADLDGDGDNDIAAAGGFANILNQNVPMEIAWYEKLGAGSYSEKLPIDTIGTTSFGVNHINISDFNGDGHNDIITDLAEFTQTIWYPGTGNGFDGLRQMTSFNGESGIESATGDLDNDGDIDMVAVRSKDIVTYENIWLDANVINLSHPNQVRSASVNSEKLFIKLEVADSTDLSSFVPIVEVSDGAIYEILDQDFADTVRIEVLAEVDYAKDFEEDFSKIWKFLVVKVPEAPELDTLEVSQTFAWLEWSKDSYTERFSLEVSENSQFLAEFVSGDDPFFFSADTLSFQIKELKVGTRYYARIRSLNEFQSQSKYSSRIDFLTLPGTPFINAINRSTITETQARVSWTPIAGEFENYNFYLEESIDGVFQPVAGFPLNVTTANAVVIGEDFGTPLLEAGTQYRVFVNAVNETGFSSNSDTINFITLSSADDVGLTLNNVGKTQFDVNWTPSKGAKHYLLDVSNDDFETILPGYQNLKVISPDTVLGNFDSGTAYSVRLRVVNQLGLSSDNSISKTVTLPGIPEILPIELPKITTTTAEIDWDAVVGNAILYEVEVSTTDFEAATTLMEGYPLTITESRIELGRDFSTKVLSSGTSYWVRIRAKNSTGYSEYSNVVSFTSLSERPIIKLDEESIGQDSVVVSWPSIKGSDNYLLDVSLDNFLTFVPGFSRRIIADTSFVVKGLDNGRRYFIRLIAQNSSGLSEESNTVEVLTLPGTPLAREPSSITPIEFTANWDPIARVEGYELQISEDENFSSVIFTEQYEQANPVKIGNLDEGKNYYYRVRSFNNAGFSGYSNVTSLTTINPDPISISLTFDDIFDRENDNVVGVVISGGYGDRTSTYRWKALGSDEWSDFIDLTELSFGQYQFVAQSTMMDELGMEFEVKVLDELGKQQVDRENFIFNEITEEDDLSLPLTKFGGKANTWQLFSIPYELDDNLIESIFDEVASKEYKKEWRLMHYRSEAGVGEYIDFGEGLNRIELGKSYWFNAIEKVSIGLGSGQSNKQVPFSLSLQQGWNQVGNPYNLNIEWSRVLLNNDASGIVGQLVGYDGTNPIRTGVLEPFSGGFVFAEQATELSIQPSNSSISSGRIDADGTESISRDIKNGWEAYLKVMQRGKLLETAFFGMSEDASVEKDPYDLIQIPRFIQYTELSSNVKAYFYSSFQRDIRPSVPASEWHFNYASNTLKGQASIQWDRDLIMSTGQPFYLIDLTSGKIIDMRSASQIRIKADQKAELKVYYGRELDEIDFGDVLLIGDVYPNPVERDFRIPLILPEEISGWNVEVDLYNVQGREVYKNSDFIQSGGYSLMDVTLSGHSLPAGVYLMSVAVKGEQEMMVQQKIIVR